MKVITFRCDDATRSRIEKSRGDVSVQRWMERAVERALQNDERAPVKAPSPTSER